MPQNGLVSVIVPLYNSEVYLRNCLNSILNQTYKNLELILVNDGSTDGTVAICEEYLAQDDRDKLFSKANGGVGSSRNEALRQISGEYVLFVDHDDWIDPHHIAFLHDKLVQSESDIAISNFSEYFSERSTFGIHVHDYYEKIMTSEEWFTYQYEGRNCFSQCFTVPWGKLYKAELFENIVFPEDEKVEDDYTTYKTYLLANRIIYLNESSYIHRKHEQSVTKTVNIKDVFPLKSIEERLTLLALTGRDISEELRVYRWRLNLHKQAFLEAGLEKEYRDVALKLQIIEKHQK
ncbi:glycosyltransferase family 2 protein [Streptococcus uberis]|uniref:glycosyltransferase family 2 protein n=1 Tax=Streptococcus uberis TaxID=1349 RepID=UPI00193B6CED|nr:glycosyltransferase family A protein [Streptococcus uberis]